MDFSRGIGSMVPTAFSQVIEQIVNAVASIVGAYFLLQMGKGIAKAKSNGSYGPAVRSCGR